MRNLQAKESEQSLLDSLPKGEGCSLSQIDRPMKRWSVRGSTVTAGHAARGGHLEAEGMRKSCSNSDHFWLRKQHAPQSCAAAGQSEETEQAQKHAGLKIQCSRQA